MIGTDSLTGLLAEIAFAVLLTALLYFLYYRYPALAHRLIGRFHVSAGRVTPYILAAATAPLLVRLAVLPWLPPPEPRIHDEFSHLLVADTLLAGRLANPPHPLSRHLETIYVLQQPTYASIYPIGQGIILAAGKALTGNPWAGVLLAAGLMCGAVSWMLYGCLPPSWAAIGGLLAAFGLAKGLWIDSYWGGAFCAFGGALLAGALCRLRKSPSKTMGLVAGLGWSIVWLTRPFESLFVLVLAWGCMAAFMMRTPRLWRAWIGPVVLILSAQIAAGLVTAVHNHAVTGSATTMPYRLSQQRYGVPQSLLWQRAIKEPTIHFAELRDMYWWQRQAKDRASQQPARRFGVLLYTAWKFFVTPWYSLPVVLLLPLLWKDRDVLVCSGVMACALTAGFLYPFFYPHYLAAYSPVIFFLIMRGLMVLSQWSFRSKAVGRTAALFLMLGGLTMGLPDLAPGAHLSAFREQVSARLRSLGGRHVVFVRYGAGHSFHDEWVYNAADIDASPIVWCRTMGPTDDSEVTRYYKDRQAWMVDVDGTVRVSRYQPGGTN